MIPKGNPNQHDEMNVWGGRVFSRATTTAGNKQTSMQAGMQLVAGVSEKATAIKLIKGVIRSRCWSSRGRSPSPTTS